MLYDDDFISTLTDDELIECYIDVDGDAGMCIDRDCSCKTVVRDLRMAIEDRGLEVPS